MDTTDDIPDEQSPITDPASGPAEDDRYASRVRVVELAELLRARIQGGEYAPGDRFPPEREFSTQLEVSRVTLRDALTLLQREGYVKTISKGASGGSFVSDLSVPAAAWMRRMRANRRELENLVEYRAAVETAAAYLAAQRREDEDLVHLRASIEDLVHFEAGDDADSKPALRRCDSTFHNTVGRASGNRMLEHAIKVSRGKFFFPFDLLASGGSRDSTIRDHEAIASAIEHRRPRQASAAMEVHIEHTRTRLREILTRLG